MVTILILGAGKSSAFLIKYLSRQGAVFGWRILVADQSLEAVVQKTAGLPHTAPLQIDPRDQEAVRQLVAQASIVISLLPPSQHPVVAAMCLEQKKHFLTASYLTQAIEAMQESIEQSGLLFLMEMGLDPGMDHMSAMKDIHEIKNTGGEIISFKSFTGGLIAPENDNNPWHYKITWNPRNVALAGQGTVKYLADGDYKYIPYSEVFQRVTTLEVPNYGKFEAYANRDSLKYIQTYGLPDVKNFMRGTLRRPGFCHAWNLLVRLGITDDSFRIDNTSQLSYADFCNAFLPEGKRATASDYKSLFNYLGIMPASREAEKFKWLGLLSADKIKITHGSPAEVLQEILEDKLKLAKGDKDMIVMQHQIIYKMRAKKLQRTSTLVNIGEDSTYTAMAKCVGLPLGIAAKLLLTGKLHLKGLQIPIHQQLYSPVLAELATYGIVFTTEEAGL